MGLRGGDGIGLEDVGRFRAVRRDNDVVDWSPRGLRGAFTSPGPGGGGGGGGGGASGWAEFSPVGSCAACFCSVSSTGAGAAGA